MLISELTFPHLLAEQDAQLMRELEWRRVATERIESGRQGGAAVAAHLSRSSRKAHRATASAKQRSGDELTGSAWASSLKA